MTFGICEISRAGLPPGHYGLHGMRERVEGLGGTLTLTSNGQGTVVEAKLPVIR